MLTRRHIRVKVMQSIYALIQSKDDSLQKQEKFLKVSIENTYTLYLLWLSLFVEIQKRAADQISLSANKYISDKKQEFPNPNKFIQNRLLLQMVNNAKLTEELNHRKLDNWYLNEEYVKLIYKEIIESEAYQEYMSKSESDYASDKELIMTLFKTIFAPNEKIYDYFEDDKLTWVDDIPIVNTFLLKHLKKAKQVHPESYFLPSLMKDDDDMQYAMQLLSRTLLKNEALEKEIEGKTPNWDKDRIAEIDSILLKMAICELLHFPSIPERVTINEYLEIAKEYSTPKSSIFINLLKNIKQKESLTKWVGVYYKNIL